MQTDDPFLVVSGRLKQFLLKFSTRLSLSIDAAIFYIYKFD